MRFLSTTFLPLLIALLIALPLGAGPKAAPPAGRPTLDEAVSALGDSPQAALELVRGGLAWRPYAGFLKGPAGAWADGCANAADAAWLLLDVLRLKGHEARFAFGAASGETVTALLTSAFAPKAPAAEIAASLPGEEVADPVQDEALRALAAVHVWVQVRQGEKWIDLDPFGRAREGGESAAPAAEKTAEEVPSEEIRRLRIEVFARAGAGEEPRAVLSYEVPAFELLGKPLALAHLGVDQKARGKRAEPALLRPALWVDGKLLLGEPYGGPATGDEATDPAGKLGGLFGEGEESAEPKAPAAVAEVYVDLTLLSGGAPERRERRYLWLSGEDGLDRLDDLTAFAVCFKSPPPGTARALAATGAPGAKAPEDPPLPPEGDLSDADRKQAEALFTRTAASCASVAAWLADSTRELSARLDRAYGTLSAAADARVIAVSLDGRRNRFSTDLLFDSLKVWARPGTKRSARAALLVERGILAADLEGQALEACIAKANPGVVALTVRAVFEAARAAGVKFTALGEENAAKLNDLPFPARTRRILAERLGSGRIVVVPVKPVDAGGKPVLAWLEADRDTGEWRGVFEDGRHQAIAEGEAVSGLEGAFAGFGFAFIGGFSGTLWAFAANVLELLDEPDKSWRLISAQAIAMACKIDWNSVILEAWGDTEGMILLGGGPEGLAHRPDGHVRRPGDRGDTSSARCSRSSRSVAAVTLDHLEDLADELVL